MARALSWGSCGKEGSEGAQEWVRCGCRLRASSGLLLCGGYAGAEAGGSGVRTQRVISAVRGAAAASFC